MLLYRSRFYVGKYISLEAKITGSKDLYYDSLKRELCPSPGICSVEGALRRMVSEGELKREGLGKSTCYYRLK